MDDKERMVNEIVDAMEEKTNNDDIRTLSTSLLLAFMHVEPDMTSKDLQTTIITICTSFAKVAAMLIAQNSIASSMPKTVEEMFGGYMEGVFVAELENIKKVLTSHMADQALNKIVAEHHNGQNERPTH